MHEENDDRGLDADLGPHVEEARGYNPQGDDKSIVDKVKDVLGVDDDDTDGDSDDVDEHVDDSNHDIV